MEFETGCALISIAQRKIEEEKLYQRWIYGYQGAMNFEEFKESLGIESKREEKGTEETAEEILYRVKQILKKG